MIIEDQMVCRVGKPYRELGKLDELPAAVAILGLTKASLAGQRVDAGEQGDCGPDDRARGWRVPGTRRQMRCGADGLNPRLLVIGDGSHSVAWLPPRGCGFLQKFDLIPPYNFHGIGRLVTRAFVRLSAPAG